MNKFLDSVQPYVMPIQYRISFLPIGHLIINDNDIGIKAGELFSEDDRLEIGAAINIEDWIFALTKYSDDSWYISGFNDRFQFFLEKLTDDHTNITLVKFVTEKIVPIIYPETVVSQLNHDTKEDVPIKWELRKHH